MSTTFRFSSANWSDWDLASYSHRSPGTWPFVHLKSIREQLARWRQIRGDFDIRLRRPPHDYDTRLLRVRNGHGEHFRYLNKRGRLDGCSELRGENKEVYGSASSNAVSYVAVHIPLLRGRFFDRGSTDLIAGIFPSLSSFSKSLGNPRTLGFELAAVLCVFPVRLRLFLRSFLLYLVQGLLHSRPPFLVVSRCHGPQVGTS